MAVRSKTLVRKALAYCIDADRLLVLRHVDFGPEEVGFQVPGGSVRDGERPSSAALRELIEETGRTEFEFVADLGVETYDITPYRDEVQERHFVLFRPTVALPGRWSCEEAHDGAESPTRLETLWIPLAQAHVLQSGQGQRLWKAIEVLGGPQPS
jgi:8-oxo-dGTP pyrophosphatase MutT (NUDIX family)